MCISAIFLCENLKRMFCYIFSLLWGKFCEISKKIEKKLPHFYSGFRERGGRGKEQRGTLK
jgi:hypothetical protein